MKNENNAGLDKRSKKSVVSFYMTKSDRMSFEILENYYELNRSALIRKLLDKEVGELKGKQIY